MVNRYCNGCHATRTFNRVHDADRVAEEVCLTCGRQIVIDKMIAPAHSVRVMREVQSVFKEETRRYWR